jgi:SNF2 family DNA or RNA helicase
MFETGQWLWSIEHRQPCKVVEASCLWDDATYHVWLPGVDSVVRAAPDRLKPLGAAEAGHPPRIRYVLYAARIANLLSEDVLLAPASASVIPLPHQLKALRRAVSQDRVRFLLADEVGLGKTIEAGLIMRELKLRGLVRRTLVITPKGLVTQWVAEMQTHFGEEFRFFSPPDFTAYRRIAPSENVWRSFDQVICSLDSVKPMEARQGWSQTDISDFNKQRFEDLTTAGWDLIIVDESHRIGGSSEQVARHQLGRGLSEASPYLLLLSATPHQGKSDAFHRLVSLLDKNAFPEPGSVTRDRIHPYVIRTEKRQAIDSDGDPLFKPRITKLVGVSWEGHQDQKQLYDAVTEYVREGYNQAMREKKTYVGFLMILMQRLVTSSTRAIITNLEKRLETLTADSADARRYEESETHLRTSASSAVKSLSAVEEEMAELDGQEQLESLSRMVLAAMRNEKSEVQTLLTAACKVEARGPDAKAETLLEWVYKFQQEEGDPDVKLLVFTEFVPTQRMLAEFLTNRGIVVTCLNGSMSVEERQQVQEQFAKEARILVSTDAGGEGLNLQFCHVVVNYDIPWNPMRIEQRIGRVDRIGQGSVVRAVNFLFEDSVEFRVREVLEQKLSVILEEFGVDKTSDVLDSAEAAHMFDTLYVEALLHPDRIPQTVDQVTETIKARAGEAHSKNAVLSNGGALSPEQARQTLNHPLAGWVQRMTENYLDAFGGKYEAELDAIRIQWPGETQMRRYALPTRTATPPPKAELLRLDHPKVRGILGRLPRYVSGMPVPRVRFASLPGSLSGVWSLWEVSIVTQDRQKRRMMPLFVHDDGRMLPPTARFLWEQLCIEPWRVETAAAEPLSQEACHATEALAREHCRDLYLEMRQKHMAQLQLEKQKAEYSFRSRRNMLQAIGLPEVRVYRLRHLAQEEAQWAEEFKRQSQALPQLTPLLILRIS